MLVHLPGTVVVVASTVVVVDDREGEVGIWVQDGRIVLSEIKGNPLMEQAMKVLLKWSSHPKELERNVHNDRHSVRLQDA